MRTRTKVLIPVAGLLVLALIAGLAVWFFVFRTPGAPADDAYARSLPYTYTRARLDVKPDQVFTYKVGYDPEKLDSYTHPSSDPMASLSGSLSDAVGVYSDPGLTKLVHVFYQFRGKKISIFPPSSAVAPNDITSASAETVPISEANRWGLNDEYYIEQKLDAKTGKPLAKPIVTRFTVQKKLATPSVSFSVDAQGIGHFAWTPVAGATGYYVVEFPTKSTPQIVGSTTKTEWTTAEQDKNLQEDIKAGDVRNQNQDFEGFAHSEDDLRGTSPGSLDDGDNARPADFGVVATNGSDFSAYTPIDGAQVQGQLPLLVALNARKEMGINNPLDVEKFGQIPTQQPVTMADGHTVLRPVVIDPKKVSKSQLTVADQDDAGHVSNVHKIPALRVPYVLGGTLIGGEFMIQDFKEASYKKEISSVAERNKKAQVKTGVSLPYRYVAKTVDLSSVKASTTAPEVPYPVNATNPLTAYLAANMMKRVEYIDVSAYMAADNHPDVSDALDEAIAQNEYILGVDSYNVYSKQNIVEVHYTFSAKETTREQEAIAREVDSVVAKVVTKDMTDTEKAKALNDYLTKSASYDYDALSAGKRFLTSNFKNAWTPYGVLIDKKGVCASYAYAYKLLADKAGLQSVVVTGFANGDGHAWNKVKMGGAWRVVDVTWDDDAANPNKYFGLTDAQAAKTRSQNNDFVIDPLVARYAAT